MIATGDDSLNPHHFVGRAFGGVRLAGGGGPGAAANFLCTY